MADSDHKKKTEYYLDRMDSLLDILDVYSTTKIDWDRKSELARAYAQAAIAHSAAIK